MSWSFGGVGFEWQPDSAGRLPARPTWRRDPRLVIRPLLGSGEADITRIGYTPWTMQGSIYLADGADATDLEALNGQVAALSDGTTTWQAVLQFRPTELLQAADGVVADVTFTRLA